MNRWFVRGFILVSAAGLLPGMAMAQEGNVDQAREALARQEGDEDSTKQLEEVFQAAEKNYSLQKKGTHSLNYSFDYSYTGDQRLDLAITNGSVRNLDVVPSATHNFTNAFSYDYGLLDNLTIGTRVPLVVKYDTQDELNVYDFGDISFTGRWQPFAYVPGKMSTTFFGTLSSKTGVSPYEIDINEQLSTGRGYYSVGGGLSMSKVLDPVVVFGSVSATYNLTVDDGQKQRCCIFPNTLRVRVVHHRYHGQANGQHHDSGCGITHPHAQKSRRQHEAGNLSLGLITHGFERQTEAQGKPTEKQEDDRIGIGRRCLPDSAKPKRGYQHDR